MPSSRRLIASNTLTSSAASVTFSSIPGTYTDLVVKYATRSQGGSWWNSTLRMTVNNNTGALYSFTILRASGSSPASVNASAQTNTQAGYNDGDTATSNTFSNGEIYIPSYTSSQYKPASSFAAQENNSATDNILGVAAILASTGNAITRLDFTVPGESFSAGSSFFLYGISNT